MGEVSYEGNHYRGCKVHDPRGRCTNCSKAFGVVFELLGASVVVLENTVGIREAPDDGLEGEAYS